MSKGDAPTELHLTETDWVSHSLFEEVIRPLLHSTDTKVFVDGIRLTPMEVTRSSHDNWQLSSTGGAAAAYRDTPQAQSPVIPVVPSKLSHMNPKPFQPVTPEQFRENQEMVKRISETGRIRDWCSSRGGVISPSLPSQSPPSVASPPPIARAHTEPASATALPKQ